jgi:hypothetical protein
MRGHSVSEVILSSEPIGYTGIARPTVVVALAAEGVARRKSLFGRLDPDCLVLRADGVEVPPTSARVDTVDGKARKIRSADWAVAALAVLARSGRGISEEMLDAAVGERFGGEVRSQVVSVVERMREP